MQEVCVRAENMMKDHNETDSSKKREQLNSTSQQTHGEVAVRLPTCDRKQTDRSAAEANSTQLLICIKYTRTDK